MALAGAVLPTGGFGVIPTLAAEKPRATAVAAADPVTFQPTSRMGAYPRSLMGFQVISSAGLEDVVVETGKNPAIRVNDTHQVKRPSRFVAGMTTP
jgi:hypothetical protein